MGAPPQRAAACVALLAMAVASCGGGSAGAPAGAAIVVNGGIVPRADYDQLLAATELRIQDTTGVAVNAKTASGRQRMRSVEAQTIRQLVHREVVAQMASAHHITLSDRELAGAIERIKSALGGEAAFSAQLRSSHLTQAQFRELYRATLLEQKLQQADPAGYQAALTADLARASVQVYVEPCSQRHDYPGCLGNA